MRLSTKSFDVVETSTNLNASSSDANHLGLKIKCLNHHQHAEQDNEANATATFEQQNDNVKSLCPDLDALQAIIILFNKSTNKQATSTCRQRLDSIKERRNKYGASNGDACLHVTLNMFVCAGAAAI